jgi:hypothetical protein
MPDDERPSLAVPRLFGRKRTPEPEPTDEPVFTDAGHDEEPTAVLTAADEPEPDVEPAPEPRVRRRDRDTDRPLLPGRPAAALSGAAAGLALVALTWVGFRGCELVRGTSSCGTGPGMVALGVLFVLAVVVGGLLLRLFRVPDPSATSFLGTGLTGVVCLVVLIDHLDHWSMVLVLPAVSAVTYLASWWVTTTYVDAD